MLWNVRHRKLLIVLAVITEVFVFWLGWFSAQLVSIEYDLAKGAKPLWADNNDINAKPSDDSGPKRLSTYLLIVIMSTPADVEVRRVIRDTWLRLSTKTPQQFRHFFPVGTRNATNAVKQSLRAEADDLVLLDDVDEDYFRLARKVAAAIRYASDRFEFDYLLKVDADSFVRVGALLVALRDVAHPRLYWGFLDGRARPFRKGKWKEPDWMLCDRYLPYQLGGGYVLARQLVDYMAANHRLLHFYRSEDVSVGAWLAGLDVKYVHDPRFDTEFTSRGCHNEYLITHKQSAAAMRSLFANLKTKGRLCATEFRTRPSYIYDFSAPPSRCCVREGEDTDANAASVKRIEVADGDDRRNLVIP